jgi:Na+/H+ antiporter NhaD/arsenite permease-like protein
MTVVELIDAHDGFSLITKYITTTNARKLLWIVGIIAFLLSAVLDNLTTTIVMVSLLRKLISNQTIRLYFVGLTIIAANAGGAWSPIGDVTTTMLWIGGQITTNHIVSSLLIPSLVCLVVPVLLLSIKIKGNLDRPELTADDFKVSSLKDRNIIFFSGIGILLFVPVFKTITHLPPFMGMLLGLAVLWFISELLHKKKEDAERTTFSVVRALERIDTPSILFFLGILLSISVLEIGGQLHELSTWLGTVFKSSEAIAYVIGLLSAIVDNVPLVAASIGMYDLSMFPPDHVFWTFLAYCAGTGGSALIIGSAAGVAAMGIEKISFMWYLKHISLIALVGYSAGAVVFLLIQ